MLLDNRYQLLDLLKASQGVETYLAEDLEADGARVVAKILRSGVAAPALVLRLEHEASVLSRLQDPAIPLIRSGRSDGSLHLIQPYLEGRNLAEVLGSGPLSTEDTLTVAGDLLSALLLDPFLQADASTTRRSGGTGLGLAIPSQLVEIMGGKLDFDSLADVGGTFWFEVPIAAAAPTSPSH